MMHVQVLYSRGLVTKCFFSVLTKNMTEKNQLAFDFWGQVENTLDERNMSLRKLCSLTGIPYSTLLNERNKAILPEVFVIKKICDTLDVTIDSLLTGKGKEAKDKSNEAGFYCVVGKLTKSQEEMLENIIAKMNVQVRKL